MIAAEQVDSSVVARACLSWCCSECSCLLTVLPLPVAVVVEAVSGVFQESLTLAAVM